MTLDDNLAQFILDDQEYIYNQLMKRAAQIGRIDIIQLLIDKGAYSFDETMFTAARYNHINIVLLMISKGAGDLNTALYYALRQNNCDIIKALIGYGANDFIVYKTSNPYNPSTYYLKFVSNLSPEQLADHRKNIKFLENCVKKLQNENKS